MIKEAHIIVGLGFGDEGKGITTDYLCSHHDPRSAIVIRYNGGQQAGHTVVRGTLKHVHSNFGSGTLQGFPTFISKYCSIYLVTMRNEHMVLQEKIRKFPKVYIDPCTIVTTPADVAWNRLNEQINKHGSCGLGVGASMKRHHETPYKIHAIDLNFGSILLNKIRTITAYYNAKVDALYNAKSITEQDQDAYYKWLRTELDEFDSAIEYLINNKIYQISSWKDVANDFAIAIFEGAQGIMLDMDYGFYPHVTYSHCTSQNAKEMCSAIGVDPSMWYVTRCYQTRHGSGPMTNNKSIRLINAEDETNVFNEWQTNFRIRELDLDQILYAFQIDKSIGNNNPIANNLMITCIDQRPDFVIPDHLLQMFHNIYTSHSQDAKDIKRADDY